MGSEDSTQTVYRCRPIWLFTVPRFWVGEAVSLAHLGIDMIGLPSFS